MFYNEKSFAIQPNDISTISNIFKFIYFIEIHYIEFLTKYGVHRIIIDLQKCTKAYDYFSAFEFNLYELCECMSSCDTRDYI